MTAAAYAHMEALAAGLASGLERCLEARAIPWQVTRVGARLEFGRAPRPRTAREGLAAIDHPLQQVLQLYLMNRGYLLTPFHSMMLVSPATTRAQVEGFLGAFEGALDLLGARMRAT